MVDPLESTSGKTPEEEVADILPVGADPATARRLLAEVPFWFHTFALNDAEGIYTPGVAVDHRYRLPFLPASFAGLRVLDVGTFDGFYAFVAEARGAERVLAVDSEQYVEWVRARWGYELEGGEGFRAIAELLGSRVEYRRLDAFRLDELGETFDFVFCFGILHRVSDPLGLLRVLRGQLADGGRVLVETYGIADDDGSPQSREHQPGDVYAPRRVRLLGLQRRGAAALGRAGGLRRISSSTAPRSSMATHDSSRRSPPPPGDSDKAPELLGAENVVAALLQGAFACWSRSRPSPGCFRLDTRSSPLPAGEAATMWV